MMKLLKKTLIWPKNQLKRLEWCKEMVNKGPIFWESVICVTIDADNQKIKGSQDKKVYKISTRRKSSADRGGTKNPRELLRDAKTFECYVVDMGDQVILGTIFIDKIEIFKLDTGEYCRLYFQDKSTGLNHYWTNNHKQSNPKIMVLKMVEFKKIFKTLPLERWTDIHQCLTK
jgi:hypothetical protein